MNIDPHHVDVFKLDQKKFSQWAASELGRKIELRNYDHIITSPAICLLSKDGAFVKPEQDIFELDVYDQDWIKRVGTLDIKQHNDICIGSILVHAPALLEFISGFGQSLYDFFDGKLTGNPVVDWLNDSLK